MTNYTFQNGAADLLGYRSDWATTNFGSSLSQYLGPSTDGTNGVFAINTTEASVGLWDTRPYQQLVLVWTGTFAQAVTLEVSIRHYTDTTAAKFVASTYATTAASGGVIQLQTGAPVSAVAAAGDAAFNAVHSYTPAIPAAVRLKLFNSAATGVVTDGTLFLYGIR